MVENYKELGCLMKLKLHYLDSHIDYFTTNLEDFFEEQGERFHQDIKALEIRYQSRWNGNMMAHYCWSLKKNDRKEKKRKRKTLVRSFQDKRAKQYLSIKFSFLSESGVKNGSSHSPLPGRDTSLRRSSE